MKDTKGYLERMKGSMGEKLFFVDHLKLDKKVIIDFGCADGALLKALKEINIARGEKCIYIGVEKNKLFYDKARGVADYMFQDLKDLGNFLKNNFLTSPVVFITSSVLHECSFARQNTLIGFVKEYCNFWVIRDMYYENCEGCNKNKLLATILEKSNAEQLSSFLLENKTIDDEVLAEWLMKYTYVENWSTEVKEHYWSVRWIHIYFWLKKFGSEIVYDNKYTNQFIKDRVLKDYGIKINWTTHRQMIIKIK